MADSCHSSADVVLGQFREWIFHSIGQLDLHLFQLAQVETSGAGVAHPDAHFVLALLQALYLLTKEALAHLIGNVPMAEAKEVGLLSEVYL